MGKKPKPVAVIELRDWSEADQALMRLGIHQSEVKLAEAWLSQEIARAKAEHAKNAGPHQEQIAALEDALKRFWLKHRDEVKGKSRELTFGTLGMRKLPPAVKLLRGWKLPDVISALGAGLKKFLRTPPPELDKPAVLKADEKELALLAKCGVAIETDGEKFFAEPDLAKIANTAKPPAA